MSIKHYLWKSILIYLLIAVNASQRENLARRHPCNPVNRRLEPYIKWTEKLANTQYKGKLSFSLKCVDRTFDPSRFTLVLD